MTVTRCFTATSGSTTGLFTFATDVNLANHNVNNGGTITAVSFVQTSKEEFKKNISKFNKNALELVKNGDVYEYNYKEENDSDKKHIGFVIGKEYKVPKEIISENGNGIDTYSVEGVLWKAVQELQKEIEKIKKEIKILKGEK